MISPYIPGFLLSVLFHIGVFFLVVESQENTIESRPMNAVPVSFIVATSIPEAKPLISESSGRTPITVSEPLPIQRLKQPLFDKSLRKKKEKPSKPIPEKPEKKTTQAKKVKKKTAEPETVKVAKDKTLDTMIQNLEKAHLAKKESVPTNAGKVKQVRSSPPQTMPKQKVVMRSQAQSEQVFKQRLQQLIARNKKYPARAKRNGEEGQVNVAFVIYANGQINNIQVTRSSGITLLDQAAVKLLKKVSGQLTFPNDLQKKQWQLSLPIEYRLR
jgi:protein TonB